LQATVLHQLGVDHRKLRYLHHGRDETPTVSGDRSQGRAGTARPAIGSSLAQGCYSFILVFPGSNTGEAATVTG